MKQEAEYASEEYKSLVEKNNQQIDMSEAEYNGIIDKFKVNEENRMFFLKCNLEKFANLFDAYSRDINEFNSVPY